MESTTYRKTLQTMALQDSHTPHCSPRVPLTASCPGKTSCKNQCAHASFILIQMRARGDAAFLIGGRYLNKVCRYNGLVNRRLEPGMNSADPSVFARRASEVKPCLRQIGVVTPEAIYRPDRNYRPRGSWPDQSIQARLTGAICQPGGITSGLPVRPQICSKC